MEHEHPHEQSPLQELAHGIAEEWDHLQEEHEAQRSGKDRRTFVCPPEGCTPVVVIGSRLTWVLGLLTFFGTMGCGLLGTQNFYLIPAMQKSVDARMKTLDEKNMIVTGSIELLRQELGEVQGKVQRLEGDTYILKSDAKMVKKATDKNTAERIRPKNWMGK